MAGWRRVVELAMTDEEIGTLTALSRSRTEPASRVSRAQMLLAYREDPSFCAVGQRIGLHYQTVQRCVERALAYGALAALDDRPRPGKEPMITPEAKAWLVSLATRLETTAIRTSCGTTRLLARHAREHGAAVGHACLARLVHGQQGADMALSAQPDLILMDMSLPVIDGWEATRRIKANDATRRIPVIALTAHAMAGDREKALEVGCVDYDTKRVEMSRLLGKIAALLKPAEG